MRAVKARYRLYRSKLTARIRTNREIANEAKTANIHRVYWTTPVMALTLFGISAFHALTINFTGSAVIPWQRRAMASNLIIGLGNLIIWLAAARLRRKKVGPKILGVFQYIVVIFVFAAGIINAIIDQMVLISVTPILISCTIVGTFYYLRPSRAFLIFAGFSLVHYFSMLRWSSLPQSALWVSQANGFVVIALGFALSIITWRGFRHSELQVRRIEAQQEKLERMAYHDSLTQLPNRRFLDEVVKAEIKLIQRKQVESSLIMFDLDDFKHINDTFGHFVGDQVLQGLAKLLQKQMRGSDILVRLGGEEFIILASNTSLGEAVELAERLRIQIEGYKFTANGNRVSTTASFGVAPLLISERAKNYYYLADRALYKAKEQGKNCIQVVETAIL